ncbi:MAG TPA: DUF1934 domain-containing protein [Candidatus Avacidaminococcus intestinavium]|uniref:DUF1934 domain-containing protein n=1 Tax=Candidatus Avacidaminococcus intestinavium TaxID=2840684 RepID=A0A9D1MNY0_9FIRM|nr:DUF1934 domain-containing protein [Candidatus Avacidaminococcus intestinavium]
MRKVKIKVEGLSAGEAGQDEMTQETQGTLRHKNDKYYVVYEEPAATGLGKTKTTLRWDSERVLLLRHGQVECRQEFANDFEDHALYITPELTIPLRTLTKELQISQEVKSWQLEIKFQMQIAGSEPNDMNLKIVIEEVDTDEC